ncbi:MAG: B12-binding domain-containing protein [Lachnospiraceae bacterium]
MIDYITAIAGSVEEGKPKLTERLVREALENGIPSVDILNQAFTPAMKLVGMKYKNEEIYIAKILSVRPVYEIWASGAA